MIFVESAKAGVGCSEAAQAMRQYEQDWETRRQ
jgi:hypothetical protein